MTGSSATNLLTCLHWKDPGGHDTFPHCTDFLKQGLSVVFKLTVPSTLPVIGHVLNESMIVSNQKFTEAIIFVSPWYRFFKMWYSM